MKKSHLIYGFLVSSFVAAAFYVQDVVDGAKDTDDFYHNQTVENAGGELGVQVAGATPIVQLYDAIQRDDISSLKRIIALGLSNDQLSQGLISATRHDRPTALELLIDAGADVNALGLGGIALGIASANNCYSCVRVLLQEGADVHARNDAALYEAARFGRYHIVGLLLDAGASPSARGEDVIASAARENGHNVVADYIKAHTIALGLSNDKLTQGLISASLTKRPTALEFIIDAGADVNVLGGIALGIASANNCYSCVRVLLQAGADVHARNDAALYEAARSGWYHIVGLLLDAGASPSARGEDVIASAARENGHNVVADYIKAHTARHAPGPGPGPGLR